MNWRELVERAEAAGVQPTDEIEVEFPDYSGWSGVHTDTLYPEVVSREYDTLTLRRETRNRAS